MRGMVADSFGGPGVLTLRDLPGPMPGAGEVLVDIKACAVNFVDLLVVAGKYQFPPKPPFIPGKLPVGVVSAIGEGVEDLRVGDRVQTLAEAGGYATRIAVGAKDCYRLPPSLSFVDAAAMALGFDTAWFAVHERGRAKAGETMLVLGASGAVGLAAVQLGKAHGLRVLAGINGASKRDLVLAAGADAVIDLSAPDLSGSLRAQVAAANDGKGADIVLDPLGGDYFDAAMRAVAWRGRLVVIGFAAGRIPSLKANYLLLKNIEVSGMQISDYRKRAPAEMRRCYEDIFALFEQGKLRAPPSEVFKLEEAGGALALLSGRRLSGRAVLTME